MPGSSLSAGWPPAHGHAWLDVEAGPVVRPYAVTGGRVRPAAGGLDVVAFVVAEPGVVPTALLLQPEHRTILRLTREPLSVAEVASRLDVALGVARVLLGDLLHEGLVSLHEPPPVTQLPNERVLEAVINGLRAL